MNFIDLNSWKLLGITMLGGFMTNLSKGDLVFLFTALAATSTVVYNGIKIYKELKNKI